jgi:hypothetical protein
MSFFRNGMATGLYTSEMGPRTLGHLQPHGRVAGSCAPRTPTTTWHSRWDVDTYDQTEWPLRRGHLQL